MSAVPKPDPDLEIRAHRPGRRGSRPGQPTFRLLLPPALPLRDRALQDRSAAAGGDPPGALRGLPPRPRAESARASQGRCINALAPPGGRNQYHRKSAGSARLINRLRHTGKSQEVDQCPRTFEKVYGCLAASRVASSMGAAVEGWHADQISATYGYLERAAALYPLLATAASPGSACPARPRTASSARS